MEILSADQIRAWDAYTMSHEPIDSIDLMERAAASCLRWLEAQGYSGRNFSIFCGKGNNGGDGLALARMLAGLDCEVTVHILEFGHLGTDDFQTNLARLHATPVEVVYIQGPEHFNTIPPDNIVVDALFGSGLNRRLDGVSELLVRHINDSACEIISVDIPSGLFVSETSKGNTVIRATHTLSFQCYKPAFLMPENAAFVGDIHILDIGLHPGYLNQVSGESELLDPAIIGAIFRPRRQFAHKGNFGHALLVAGSFGKMGAAVLAAGACLRAGAGLLTCQVPGCGYSILQTALPEAMLQVDPDERLNSSLPGELDKYSVVGIGPGIGTDPRTASLVKDILSRFHKPVVADADALNIMATHPKLLEALLPTLSLPPIRRSSSASSAPHPTISRGSTGPGKKQNNTGSSSS
ncbi:NAD(P)H-hydrate epimerase [Puia sp. P3]|uniref:NAD(P)H-hydrate epimerase n=1 Tax=Puia sp. P3 TaxID=3423952 RepID=UPI003D676557